MNISIPIFRRSVSMACAVFAASLLLPASPAFAVSKEIVQLQTQVQQLQDAVARLQQSNDERMGVMKDLVQQSADSVNRMSLNIDSLQKQLQNRQQNQDTKVDQVSGQIQALNDSLDELKARMGRLEKIAQDIQSQQQTMNANLPPATGGGIPADNAAPPASTPPPAATTPAPVRRGKPAAGTPMSEVVPAPQPTAAPAAPPVDDLYKTALGDYMGAKYQLASSEFGDVIKSYPDHPLAGNASYYQGEIAYRAGHYEDAIKSYDRVIEQYGDSNKVPVSHLHKGQALLALKQNDAGVRELRALIQRFPNSPEAMQARSKLSGMGVTVVPRH
ncbi:tetratricopeptide repeat protein [Edaphobacter sp. HDX4]|uniref:tetratricopeptide repeat protein n=1 Tax=Edaphobacter sp. HDX4 TaxID=2794064 RepID=UPI002FE64263